MGFGDIKIPAKLTLVFAALALTIALTGGIVHVNSSAHERSMARMADAHRAMLAASRVAFALIRQENSVRGFLLSGDPNYLRRISETHGPAFEAALTDLRAFGAGLGLAICCELTGLMGGSVSVESAPGEGSCFIMGVPLTRQAARQAA